MGLLFQLFSRRRRYDDLSSSIHEHIEERTEELMADGMPRKQAEQVARREFGNVALVEQRSREAWQWPEVERLGADLRFAARRLRRSPAFALTVLATLAIGMGANTAVFTVVNSVLLKPLPYPNPGRLVSLRLDAPGAGGLASFRDGLLLSPSLYTTFAEHNRTLEHMGVWVPGSASVTGVGEPEQVKALGVSDGLLEALDVAPVAGRWLNGADQVPRGPRSVMLSYTYWQRRFGGNAAVVGQGLVVDGLARTVVGVMPRGFRVVDQDFDVMAPLQFDRAHMVLAGFGFEGIARLRPGVTVAEANADLGRQIGVWMDSFSNGPGSNSHYYDIWRIHPDLRPLKEKVLGNVGSVLWVVMGTIGLVMLITCMNVANLLLVRAEARQQELAIRAALGAGRGRIARELLLESLMLGLLGGAAAMAAAWAALRLLVRLGPTELPRLVEIQLDGWSLAFTLSLSVASGVLFGAVPVWRYARTTAVASTGGTRTASLSRERHRSRDLLVVGQVAMALVLLVSATLMIRTFAALKNVDPGLSDAAHVETVAVSIPEPMATDPHRVAAMQRAILNELAAIPGVQSAAFAADVPMDGGDPNWDMLMAEGKNYEGGEPPLLLYNYVSPDYFRTMGTRLVAGRDFTWDDLQGVRPVLMVSESFARANWGSAGAAVGKRVKKYSQSPWQQVIGVVEDVRVHGANAAAPPVIYWPAVFYGRFDAHPEMNGLRDVTYAVHSSRAGSESLLGQMQQAVWKVNADLPLAGSGTMADLERQSMARTSFTLVMLALAGCMALALGVVGIYGVISYTVAQRTREIGIRLALGAKKQAVTWMFVQAALRMTAVGVAIGVVAAAGLMQFMKALLFGIQPLDPVTYFAVPLLLLAAAALASYLPARRAAAVDPVVALRAE